MKHIKLLALSSYLLTLLTLCACDDRNDNPAGELLVTVSGRCTATVKLYDYNATKQLGKHDYDCEHAKFIQFKPPQTGLYILIATSGDDKVTTTCPFVQGYIKEITIEFDN
jgi:hypothetical protein